ncbi:MAG: hypothetical protein EOO88_62655 [Pedobacter sp.]|nr:MAG: hypothetical protein EOO88_62655 [Pedobacter sp.]
MTRQKIVQVCIALFVLVVFVACGKKAPASGPVTPTPPIVNPPQPPATNDVDWWLTTGNQSSLLQKQIITRDPV